MLLIPSALQRRKETKDDPDHFLLVSPEYEAFSKQWFEVGIQYPGVDSEVSPLNMDYSPSPSPYTGMAYSSYTKSPYDYTRLYGGRTCELGGGRREGEREGGGGGGGGFLLHQVSL